MEFMLSRSDKSSVYRLRGERCVLRRLLRGAGRGSTGGISSGSGGAGKTRMYGGKSNPNAGNA